MQTRLSRPSRSRSRPHGRQPTLEDPSQVGVGLGGHVGYEQGCGDIGACTRREV